MGEVGEFSNINWSPDGKSVVFAGLKQGQSDLYQYHFDTKKLDQLTNDAFSETQPAFSNDGKRLVFGYDRLSTENDVGVEINFNLAIWAMIVVGWVLFITVIGIPFAIILWLVAGVGGLFFHIRAALRANRGESYSYPWQIRVLS